MAYAIAGFFFLAWCGLVLLLLRNSRRDDFKSQFTRDAQRHFDAMQDQYREARQSERESRRHIGVSTQEMIELQRGRW